MTKLEEEETARQAFCILDRKYTESKIVPSYELKQFGEYNAQHLALSKDNQEVLKLAYRIADKVSAQNIKTTSENPYFQNI